MQRVADQLRTCPDPDGVRNPRTGRCAPSSGPMGAALLAAAAARLRGEETPACEGDAEYDFAIGACTEDRYRAPALRVLRDQMDLADSADSLAAQLVSARVWRGVNAASRGDAAAGNASASDRNASAAALANRNAYAAALANRDSARAELAAALSNRNAARRELAECTARLPAAAGPSVDDRLAALRAELERGRADRDAFLRKTATRNAPGPHGDFDTLPADRRLSAATRKLMAQAPGLFTPGFRARQAVLNGLAARDLDPGDRALLNAMNGGKKANKANKPAKNNNKAAKAAKVNKAVANKVNKGQNRNKNLVLPLPKPSVARRALAAAAAPARKSERLAGKRAAAENAAAAERARALAESRTRATAEARTQAGVKALRAAEKARAAERARADALRRRLNAARARATAQASADASKQRPPLWMPKQPFVPKEARAGPGRGPGRGAGNRGAGRKPAGPGAGADRSAAVQAQREAARLELERRVAEKDAAKAAAKADRERARLAAVAEKEARRRAARDRAAELKAAAEAAEAAKAAGRANGRSAAKPARPTPAAKPAAKPARPTPAEIRARREADRAAVDRLRGLRGASAVGAALAQLNAGTKQRVLAALEQLPPTDRNAALENVIRRDLGIAADAGPAPALGAPRFRPNFG